MNMSFLPRIPWKSLPHRLPKYLTISLLGLAACASNGITYSVPALVFDPEILEHLHILGEGLYKEYALCLLGKTNRRNNVTRITGLGQPIIRESTISSVQIRSLSTCTPTKLVGIWHNHPPAHAHAFGRPPSDLCTLSKNDVDFVLKNKIAFAVVHTSDRIMCWWHYQQIVATPRTLWGELPSIPGQRTF
jgi:hypothetical protein